MLVSKAKFLQYQAMFYKKLLATPYKIQLEIVTVRKPDQTEEFTIESFVGDSVRESTFYEFRALYEKEIPERTREKYGLPKEVNGVVYLSPKQLVPGLELDGNHVKVNLSMETNIPGLFACGDITGTPYQYIKAAGQGNVAALSAVAYLDAKKCEAGKQ